MSSPSFLEWLFYKIIGLKLNKDKCIFITDKLKFFGVEISNEGISPDKKKIKAIKHVLPPSNISELRNFIGLCTYVLRFIENYSEKTAVLNEFLRNNKKFFVWGEETYETQPLKA